MSFELFFFNHMEIHMPPSLKIEIYNQLGDRKKSCVENTGLNFLYNVFRHLGLQQQTFLSE